MTAACPSDKRRLVYLGLLSGRGGVLRLGPLIRAERAGSAREHGSEGPASRGPKGARSEVNSSEGEGEPSKKRD